MLRIYLRKWSRNAALSARIVLSGKNAGTMPDLPILMEVIINRLRKFR